MLSVFICAFFVFTFYLCRFLNFSRQQTTHRKKIAYVVKTHSTCTPTHTQTKTHLLLHNVRMWTHGALHWNTVYVSWMLNRLMCFCVIFMYRWCCCYFRLLQWNGVFYEKKYTIKWPMCTPSRLQSHVSYNFQQYNDSLFILAKLYMLE